MPWFICLLPSSSHLNKRYNLYHFIKIRLLYTALTHNLQWNCCFQDKINLLRCIVKEVHTSYDRLLNNVLFENTVWLILAPWYYFGLMGHGILASKIHEDFMDPHMLFNTTRQKPMEPSWIFHAIFIQISWIELRINF